MIEPRPADLDEFQLNKIAGIPGYDFRQVVFSNSGVVVYQHTESHTSWRPAMQTQTRTAPTVRAFGTGYGRSSSYGAPRSYTATTVPARFRVA